MKRYTLKRTLRKIKKEKWVIESLFPRMLGGCSYLIVELNLKKKMNKYGKVNRSYTECVVLFDEVETTSFKKLYGTTENEGKRE